jgi:1-acyl-sn-glycerol-3-phosphate acyltransferase
MTAVFYARKFGMKNEKAFDGAWGACIAASMRVLGFFTLTAVMIPIHLFYLRVKSKDPFYIPRIYHRILLRLLGFRVRVHGTIARTKQPVLFVANHTSYLDIPVLGALIPAAFVAKSEVAGWPFIGFLAKLQGTLFIERRASRADDHRNFLGGYLAKGQSLILFPEGTSSDGLSVLPFKSGLFSIVENVEGNTTIQPVSIACTALDGLPIIRAWRPFYAWYGDMTLVGHLWNVFKMGRFTVDVVFHPPVEAMAFAGRKALATYCHGQVARGIEQCLTGRDIAVAGLPQLPAPA